MRSRKAQMSKSRGKAAKPLLSKTGPSVSKQAKPRPEPERRERLKVTLRLRPSLKKAMDIEAQARGLTVQALCLFGLRKLGLPVTSADLADGRKSEARAKRSLSRKKGSGKFSGKSSASSTGVLQLQDLPAESHQLIELLLAAIGQHGVSAAAAPNINIMCSRCGCV